MSVSIGIRPMGYARRMGRPVPIGAAIPAGSRFDQILRDLASDPFLQIAGRDGSMSLATPGCTFLDVPTGAPISANRAWNMIGPSGLVLPFYTAFPQIVNLFPAISGTTNVTNTLSGLTRTLTEDTNTGAHQAAGAATLTLTDGATYTIRCIVSRKSGSLAQRHGLIYVSRSGQTVSVIINLDTGAITTSTAGGGTVVGTPSSTALGAGRYLISAQITNAAWGGAVNAYHGINESASSVDVTFTGDGVSGVVYEAATLTLGTQTPLGVAEAGTRAADANVWTMADALTQNEEIIVLSAQCYASGDMGITAQTWAYTASLGVQSFLVRSAGGLTAQDTDGGGVKSDAITRTFPNKTILCMQRMRRRPTELEAGFNQSLSGSPTAGGSDWSAFTSIRIGNSATAGRDSYALNACLRRKGGFTQAQIDALFFGFANGRTIPVAA